MKAKKYSVLLLYPDYIAETFGHETYLVHVEAKTPKQAIATAQMQATSQVDEMEKCQFLDFHCLACFAGHVFDLNTGK